MNAKILSVLFILFAGIGFFSCSNDDSSGSSYDSGKQQGEKLRNAVNTYSSNTVQAGADALAVYSQYKKNSSDTEWKKGFLGGATNFDESKYSGLEKLLEQDVNLENIANILPNLLKLLN
ncbi:MAG: hypothetical protein LBR52_02490 [Prevotellaceae bacterium]|jgi:hypothetical protein|nr:hypothetical protein [Prevotellaceae bacterium]